MTREKAKEFLPIIEAYSCGKSVEIYGNARGWIECHDPYFNNCKYRIKSQPKLVPFTFEDNKLFRDKWIKVKGCMPMSKISSFDIRGIYFGRDVDVNKYDYCLKNFEFEDGSPFGKYVNE